MTDFLFDAAFLIYGLFALPFFVAKGKHRQGWAERWGRVPSDMQERLRGRPVFWIHAVSVGEARLGCHLVSQIRRRIPGMTVLFTTTTPSGRIIAKKRLAPEDEVLYFPFDFSFAVNRFLNAVKPRIAILMETEIWPNMIRQLERRGIPRLIVNGRISDGAYGRYRWAAFALRNSLRRLTMCLVQSEAHRERFIRLGADPAKVKALGNMKFDVENEGQAPNEELAAAFMRLRSEPDARIFFCSSTHAGEEEALLSVYVRLKGLFPHLRLVIAPRHIERLASIESLISRRNLSVVRLSKLLSGSADSMCEIVLVDVWGILSHLYPLADVIFMGGSLVPLGGHNIAEGAVFGKPVLCGPYLHNFKDMADEFLRNEGVLVVRSEPELENETISLFRDSRRCELLGRRAREVVLKNQGATHRYIEEVLLHLPRNASDPVPARQAV